MKPKRTSTVHLKLTLTDELIADLGLREGNAERLVKLIQRMPLQAVVAVCAGVRIVPCGTAKEEEVINA